MSLTKMTFALSFCFFQMMYTIKIQHVRVFKVRSAVCDLDESVLVPFSWVNCIRRTPSSAVICCFSEVS